MTIPAPMTLGTIRVAREAALSVRRSARPQRLRFKLSPADVVTATDTRVERLIRRWLSVAHPHDAVVGEEGGGLDEMDLSRPTWFVDPVDGTTNFVRGIPHYACAICYWDGERLAAGVVVDIGRRRTYWAETGRGAFEGRRRMHVSTVRRLDRSVLATGFPPQRATEADDNVAEFGSVVRTVRDVRRLGCAGIDMSWVASGRLDGYWEQRCGPWDWAPGALFVREAGGRVTNYAGLDWRPGDPDLIASNGLFHAELQDAFATARREAGLALRPGAGPSWSAANP
jgi:myo-inositol-1(or 4)-monophosphatase